MSSMRAFRFLSILFTTLLLRAVPASSQVTIIAIDPQTPTTLYAATSDGAVSESTDGGVSWRATALINSDWITALVVDPQTPGTVYAAHVTNNGAGGIFKATDGGDSWNMINSVLPDTWVGDLEIDPQTPTTQYSATPAGVFKSVDEGRTWNLVLKNDWFWNTTIFQDVAIDAQNPRTVYASVYYATSEMEFGEVLKSIDAGASWYCIWCANWWGYDPLPPPIGRLTLGSDAVYAASLYYPTVFKGVGDGNSWVELAIAPDICCDALEIFAADRHDPSTLYAVLSSAGVFKSVDAGGSWTAASAGLPDLPPSGVGVLVVDPRDSSTLYVATNLDVFKSTDGATSWSPIGSVPQPLLARLDVPGGVPGGIKTTATVTLSVPAPEQGAYVSLSSSDLSVVTVPAQITVAQATRSQFFWIYTNGVSSPTSVKIVAALDGTTKSAVLVVTPAILPHLDLSPTSVTGGMPSTGTVTLAAPAASTGAVIALGSYAPEIAAVPASVAIAPGATSATFTISTSPVSPSTTVTIFAIYGGVMATGNLAITAPAPVFSSLSLTPISVSGGTVSIGTVSLGAAAAAGGALVALASSDPGVAAVPASVNVAPDATGATFTISTNPVPASTDVTISATYGGVTRANVLTVTAPTLSSLTVNPTSVSGGATSTGIVTLSGPAPAGAGVPLSSTNTAAAIVPASVTVPAGAISATFTVSTSASCATATSAISSSYGGVTKSTVLTIIPGPTDAVAIQRADYFRNRSLLRVSATSSIRTATLRLFMTSSDALVGTLTNDGAGRYSGEFAWPTNPHRSSCAAVPADRRPARSL